MKSLVLDGAAVTDFDSAIQREWLVTNGLGGFAAGTVAGVNTRRYHGLLIASLRPPVERTLLVAKLEAVAIYRGVRTELAANEFGDGTIAPQGYRHLESFHLEGTTPVWTYRLGDAALEQRIWMTHGENSTYLSFTLLRASESLSLEFAPLCTYRDYHWQLRGQHEMRTTVSSNSVAITAGENARPFRIVAESGAFVSTPDWYWNFKHRAESDRGLDDGEDLFRPGFFNLTLAPGETSALLLTAEGRTTLPSAASRARHLARQSDLLQAGAQTEPGAQQLILAADQFVVERRLADGTPVGSTVIAGYPWFSDWGRDTMIALPGLSLSTGRPQIAASVLRTFARFVSEGMLPNRFPDAGEVPEYNTVDATLWYFVAVDEYVRHSGDIELLRELYPVLKSIISWHQRGTRYGIRLDTDGLLHSGEQGVQLTWMDAKIGDWVVTPRTGKCVEINALWFNALTIMSSFGSALGQIADALDYRRAADLASRSFNERFWCAQSVYQSGYLYDVIDTPDGSSDASLRPNQLFALSLRHPLLTGERAQAVVDICERTLWTPVGLRSLAPGDARYAGHYTGAAHERDAVYHQGTVWSWLLGPFALAHYRVYRDASRARAFLSGMQAHLSGGCVGQVSEIFDGDAPFTPRGCFAQAWGVAETLRAWSEINAYRTENRKTSESRHESRSAAATR